MPPNPLKSYVFFWYHATLPNPVRAHGRVLFLSIQWVCKWRRGARKHLQTCLQAFGTTLRDYLHYNLYGFVLWWYKKNTQGFGPLKKTLLIYYAIAMCIITIPDPHGIFGEKILFSPLKASIAKKYFQIYNSQDPNQI